MDTLEHILGKYRLKAGRRAPLPVQIPNVGRDDLARLFAELGFRVIVEVGVLKGQYTEVLCRANPDAKIYGVDPWQAYAEYKDFVDQGMLDRFRAEAQTRLAPCNCSLIRKFSMDAVDGFEDGSIDAVYLDGNHEFPHVVEDIYRWGAKVRPGGILSGHDYYKMRRLPGHVIEVVQAWTAAYTIRPWFVLGRQAKVSGEVRDWSRSWFWVKA